MPEPRGRTGRARWAGAAVLLGALAGARGAAGQQPAAPPPATAVVVGIVADTGKQPITEAEVLATRHKISTITDHRGIFILPGLVPGPESFLVRKIGYRAESFDATLVAGDTIRLGVILAIAPFQLPDVTVEAEGRIYVGKMAGFGDRLLHSGAPRSSFFTQADIDRLRPRKTIDLLSRAGLPFRIRGGKETIGCNRGASGMSGSQVMVFVDGARMGGGFDLSWLDPSDIQAVEVYKSSVQRPPEFSSGNADCTVVIWTK
jgi:carboxypeptidase family protein/TonB-dependent receptor-like protein